MVYDASDAVNKIIELSVTEQCAAVPGVFRSALQKPPLGA
jgi:hypothetical protein